MPAFGFDILKVFTIYVFDLRNGVLKKRVSIQIHLMFFISVIVRQLNHTRYSGVFNDLYRNEMCVSSHQHNHIWILIRVF